MYSGKAKSCSQLALASMLLVTACGDRTTSATAVGVNQGNARITAMHFGRLTDVYGFRTVDGTKLIELYAADVVVGPDILDERENTSLLRDEDVRYDFITPDPDTLQPRLLITRELGSTEFEKRFDALDDKLRPISPTVFGRDVETFSAVPRNAAILLTFAEPLGIGDDFFVATDESGRRAPKNTEAVQLLSIVGDPNDDDPRGDFQVIPSRVIVRANTLTIDPVLIGSEGPTLQSRNRATGMPESPDRTGANIRIAIALEGPLAIPGIFEDERSVFIGTNNAGERSAVRDFRSGNRDDDTPELARGFVRDPSPPRLIGHLPVLVERVDRFNDSASIVTLFKNGREHEFDEGDVLRVVDPAPGPDLNRVFASGEILEKPLEDSGDPAIQRVRVIVRKMVKVDTVFDNGRPTTRQRVLEDIDPTNHPNFPADRADREAWLARHAPRATVVSEFTSRRRRADGAVYGDDPINFVQFSPTALSAGLGPAGPGDTDVSPFAGAILRFTKPIDLTTTQSLETMFFATRDLFDREKIREDVIIARRLDPDRFNWDKFRTPHLIVSRIFDDDGSQTSLRLQPALGFFLNDEMRQAEPLPYYLHLLAGEDGIKDISGNELDLQSDSEPREFLTVPFTLDTRERPEGGPVFENNQVVNIVRRYADVDEDEQPSIYRDEEQWRRGDAVQPVESLENPDVFGAASYESDGRLIARPTARVTRVVDDVNQTPPPAQGTLLQMCPPAVNGDAQIVRKSAAVKFGAPIQNPLNPFGARLQTVWREVDMSLSRTDPADFNLDVEQLYWAPFTGNTIAYDEFDRVSLFLSHSERRPELCVGQFSALPSMPNSGLSSNAFADNVAHDLAANSGVVLPSPQVPAFVDQRLTIDPGKAVAVTGTNRFLPLPEFQQPHFVWRNELETVQGGTSGIGVDVYISNPSAVIPPYVLSPWLSGQGRMVTRDFFTGETIQSRGTWLNFTQFNLQNRRRRDVFTGGGLGAIALPLLADFWVYPDDPDLPDGFGFRASGINGWQISLGIQSSALPNFRAYSSGFAGTRRKPTFTIDPGSPEWQKPTGGFTPRGVTTPPADNSVYWIMADLLKRQTVVTSGFVEILNPHRMPRRVTGEGDPRLGPYFVDHLGVSRLPAGVMPTYDWTMEPTEDQLPRGTAVIPEFRAAGPLDDRPWRSFALGQYQTGGEPDAANFPLDPLKACDAYLRKFDDRSIFRPRQRNYWTHYYNENLTRYTNAINDLTDDRFIRQFAGPTDQFTAEDVRYFNWRFIMRNNVESNPPVSPAVDSFAVVYRFERR